MDCKTSYFAPGVEVHCEYVPVEDWPHSLTMMLQTYERGKLTRADMKRYYLLHDRTRRWVIDDLYGAVQRKGRRRGH